MVEMIGWSKSFFDLALTVKESRLFKNLAYHSEIMSGGSRFFPNDSESECLKCRRNFIKDWGSTLFVTVCTILTLNLTFPLSLF